GLGERLDPAEDGATLALIGDELFRLPTAVLGYVGTRNEGPVASPRKDHAADGAVGGDIIQMGSKLPDQRCRERIELVRTVERQPGNAGFQGLPQYQIVHVILLRAHSRVTDCS